jgi:hypothetical protein
MKNIALIAPIALLAGCFTLKQTEMPDVQFSRAPQNRDVSVAVSGFAATITTYTPIYGHQTVFVDNGPYYGPRGRRYYGGGHYRTVTSETFVPQVSASDAYLRHAQTILEDSGFLLRTPSADYTVEVTFGGPFIADGERAVEYAWMFLSLFSAEYATQTWTAKLRIHDSKTGRLLLGQEYVQKYEDCAWSPLFFIGLAGYTENTFNFMQNWCLTALTRRTMADATAFLAKRSAEVPPATRSGSAK